MPYTFEIHDNPSAYIVTLDDDFEMQRDLPRMSDELVSGLAEDSEPITIIVVLKTKRFALDNLFNATKFLKDNKNLAFMHPNCKQIIMVTDKAIMRKSMDGFHVLGFIKSFYAVETLQEALELA